MKTISKDALRNMLRRKEGWKLVPVCADDRECKPKGIPCYGHKPRLRRSPRTRALKRNQGGE